MKKVNIIIGVCIFLLTFICAVRCTKKNITVQEVDSLIMKEIPNGSSQSQVLSFLKSHNIGHSEVLILVDDNDKSWFRDSDPIEKKEDINSVIHASLPKVEVSLFSSWGIFMKFYFDKEGRLIDYRVQKVGTSV